MLQLLPGDLVIEIFCKLKFIQMDIVLVNKRIFDVFKCNEWYICKKIINSYMLLSTEHYKKIIKNLDCYIDPITNTIIFDDTILQAVQELYSHFELVKFLIKNGAQVNGGNLTPLSFAIFKGNVKITELLIEKGANIKGSLRYAAAYNNIEIVKLLLEKEADIHENENEAVNQAFFRKNREMIDFLIKHGADIHMPNNQALRLATRMEAIDILELLYEYNIDIHRNNEEALRLAAEFGYDASVKFFIDHGGNKELALQIATEHGNDNIIEMIKNKIENN